MQSLHCKVGKLKQKCFYRFHIDSHNFDIQIFREDKLLSSGFQTV